MWEILITLGLLAIGGAVGWFAGHSVGYQSGWVAGIEAFRHTLRLDPIRWERPLTVDEMRELEEERHPLRKVGETQASSSPDDLPARSTENPDGENSPRS